MINSINLSYIMSINEKEHLEEKRKILEGLDLVYERLLAFKKYKKTDLVVFRDNKIMQIKVE